MNSLSLVRGENTLFLDGHYFTRWGVLAHPARVRCFLVCTPSEEEMAPLSHVGCFHSRGTQRAVDLGLEVSAMSVSLAD